ncbi:alpha/beta fold hydrolase [Iamia sp. SCSIO 61187]|uniref:alpha/beta fold hydrolase n=1 Tax=Iamia sp. SCSIO 61187 TaxID=2722752 RepID=UPI001C62F005|nr:alpha/beta fold hydrolase [Iamia sp. SCSIO 61187]QYG91457.1 alpha/beta fold hydrolase [Iamia sp. SCSIO 61187]
MATTTSEMVTVPVRGGHVVVDEPAPGHLGPPVLLVAGTGGSMDFWRPDLCAALAAAGLRVIRFDQRDTGAASADPAGAPSYGLPDLVDDALAVLDATGVDAAHWVGFSQGGWVAQLAAVRHPHRVASLTLVASRPVAHGPNDPDLPEVRDELMEAFAASAPPPPPGDAEAWVEYLVAGERPFGSDRSPFAADDARALAAVVVERTRDLEAMVTNHPIAPQGDRWRERLGEVTVPVAVVHGEDDPLFPLGNGEALARELATATLHAIPGMGHELPARVRPTVAAVIIDTVRRGEAASAAIDEVVARHLGGAPLVTMPNTEVRPSEIDGRGLFATAPLAAGSLVGVLDGQVVDPESSPMVVDALEWNALTPTALLVRPIRTSYGFMNHSEHPNVAIDADGRRLWAQGSIEAGQELTLDYLAQPVPERYLSSPEVRRLRPTPPV